MSDELQTKSAPDDRAAAGPFDESEANPVRPYIDLGGIKVLPREGLNLRLEVEEQTGRIVAVGLDYADSTLQVQPFAAPRTTGLWEETREQIRQQIRQPGGRVEEREGPLGPELLAEVPVAAGPDATPGKRLARFVGVENFIPGTLRHVESQLIEFFSPDIGMLRWPMRGCRRARRVVMRALPV